MTPPGIPAPKHRPVDSGSKRVRPGRRWLTGNELLKELIIDIKESSYQYMKKTTEYINNVNIKYRELINLNKSQIKARLLQWDTNRWKEEIAERSPLSIYQVYKSEIKEENIYDNHP